MTYASVATRFAVIVPYYQQKPGLLHRCVMSVMEQRNVEHVHAFVIDDSSPHPAGAELSGIKQTEKITVIRQDNAGPGRARNRGIEAAGDEFDIIAFIDSDDAWRPDYLSTAAQAFHKGADMFFANTERDGSSATRFEWGSEKGRAFATDGHESLDESMKIYCFRGDFFSHAVEKTGMISTSTLAYRHSKYRALRFNASLYNGQDRLFKLKLAVAAERVAFSPRVLAVEGAGINIFDNSQWGSPNSLRMLSSYINLAKATQQELPLTALHRQAVRYQLNESRLSYIASFAHLLRKGEKMDWRSVLATLRQDPAVILQAPRWIKGLIVKSPSRTDGV